MIELVRTVISTNLYNI